MLVMDPLVTCTEKTAQVFPFQNSLSICPTVHSAQDPALQAWFTEQSTCAHPPSTGQSIYDYTLTESIKGLGEDSAIVALWPEERVARRTCGVVLQHTSVAPHTVEGEASGNACSSLHPACMAHCFPCVLSVLLEIKLFRPRIASLCM